MDTKKIRTSFNRFLAWFAISLCSLIVKIIPASSLYAFATSIGNLGYFVASKHRKIALESLNTAFGREKTPQEIESIAKTSFVHMLKSMVELMFFFDKPAALKDRAIILGKENFDKALASGRGVILISAHFGNFPLLLGRLAVEGYKVGGIMKPMRDVGMEKMFFKKREKFGVRTIYSQPRNECVRSSIQALRDNESIFIPIDQNFGTGGIFVDFFGQKAATATGPVILAQRTKAALVPVFIIRQSDDTHKIIFEPEVELVDGKDSHDFILINIQRLTNVIETYIRKYPVEWGWIHRRWKSKPSQ
jgi:KDO2-lipid IV(A) lauroyltransferase